MLVEHVIMTEAEHGAVLLDERTGRYWLVNDTGAIVLRCLRNGGTAETAANHLCVAYEGLDIERATREATALIERLRDNGLVARP